jgi:mRNA interferase MazF
MTTPVRSQVFFVDLGSTIGRKPFVIVTNNRRNKVLDTVLGVRITTTNRNTHIDTVVPLGRDCGDLSGWALCDDVEKLWTDELSAPAGTIGPRTMAAINNGLMAALGLE